MEGSGSVVVVSVTDWPNDRWSERRSHWEGFTCSLVQRGRSSGGRTESRCPSSTGSYFIVRLMRPLTPSPLFLYVHHTSVRVSFSFFSFKMKIRRRGKVWGDPDSLWFPSIYVLRRLRRSLAGCRWNGRGLLETVVRTRVVSEKRREMDRDPRTTLMYTPFWVFGTSSTRSTMEGRHPSSSTTYLWGRRN